MDHFRYIDYKEFIIHLINNGRGRGEFARISESLNVSTVLVSQIFKGHKDLTFEQGIKLTEYFAFTELETKYFISCLSFNKAGNQELKKFYKKEMEQIRSKSIEIASLVPNKKVLTDLQKSIYYSDWTYAAIHLACALPFIKQDRDLSTYLGIELEIVQKVLTFLIECELIGKVSGELSIGTTHIHLDKTSSFLVQHHRNWRMLSSLRSANIQENEVMYTAPMVISKKLSKDVHTKLLQTISEIVKSTEGCLDEETWCLNLDFIQIKDQRF
jgi:uncharacterized protein (TIGR02147 family)